MNGNHNYKKPLPVLALCLTGLLLGGCDNDKSSGASAPAASTVSGTAAVGAPIPSATVTLTCANQPDTVADRTTVTTATGTFSFASVPNSYLPCGLTIAATATTPEMHSFVTAATGSAITANITPLTELVFAQAIYNAGLTNTTVAQFLQTPQTPATLSAVVAAVPAAVTSLVNTLNAASTGTDLPSGFNPITLAFAADGASQYDSFLDDLATALGGTSYATFLANVDFSAGLSFPAITVTYTPPAGGGGGGTGTMTIVTSVNGIATPAIIVNGVATPGDTSQFCAMGQVTTALAGAGVSNISCSFSGNTGTITGSISVSIPGMGTISQNWASTYTFS